MKAGGITGKYEETQADYTLGGRQTTKTSGGIDYERLHLLKVHSSAKSLPPVGGVYRYTAGEIAFKGDPVSAIALHTKAHAILAG
jgi:hypothetical protein